MVIRMMTIVKNRRQDEQWCKICKTKTKVKVEKNPNKLVEDRFCACCGYLHNAFHKQKEILHDIISKQEQHERATREMLRKHRTW